MWTKMYVHRKHLHFMNGNKGSISTDGASTFSSTLLASQTGNIKEWQKERIKKMLSKNNKPNTLKCCKAEKLSIHGENFSELWHMSVN